MAKRGETRPFRITYEWLDAGGTVWGKGTETRSSESEADDVVRQLRRNADLAVRGGRGTGKIRITIQHRDEAEPRSSEVYQGKEEVESDVW